MTISLPPRLIREADKAAKSEGRSRSELFREAVRQYLVRRERWDTIFAFGAEAARQAGIAEENVAGLVKGRRRSRPT